MSCTLIKVLRQDNDPPFKCVTVDASGPLSYTTGGESILATEIGLSSIEHACIINGAVDSAHALQREVIAVLPIDTPGAATIEAKGVASMKVVFKAVGGAEVAGATDQRAYRFRMKVWGNGS